MLVVSVQLATVALLTLSEMVSPPAVPRARTTLVLLPPLPGGEGGPPRTLLAMSLLPWLWSPSVANTAYTWLARSSPRLAQALKLLATVPVPDMLRKPFFGLRSLKYW